MEGDKKEDTTMAGSRAGSLLAGTRKDGIIQGAAPKETSR